MLIDKAINYFQSGNHQEAERLCKELIRNEPNNARAYRLLGIIAHQYTKSDIARELLAKALELDPQNIDIYIELGLVTKQGCELDHRKAQDAINIFETAFKLDPSQAKALLMISAVLIEFNELDEALNIATLAIEVEPASADTHINLGNIFKLQGKLKNAIGEYQIALKLNPGSGIALHNLIDISKYKNDPEAAEQNIKQAKQLLKSQRPRSEEILLNFAIAKIYNELEDYQNAFKYYRSANELKSKSISYSQEVTKAKTKCMTKEVSKAELSEAKPNLKAYSEFPVPIFILGMPRSGSSLIEQILASHSDVYGAGELFYFPQSIAMREESASAMQECLEKITKLNSEELTELGLKYLRSIKERSKSDAKYICDKLPANFWYVPMIRHILPQAIIIHSERNAADTCFSCYQQNFTNGHNYVYDLENLANYHNCYSELMQHWKQLYGSELYSLSYETLIDNPEAEIRKLLEHCKLDWQDNCMNFHETKRNVSTASAMQVRQPIYKQSVAKWRNYEPYLEPLLKILKY